MDYFEPKPILVSNPLAKKLLGVGNTKYWELVKEKRIKMVMVGRRRMPTYESLEAIGKNAE